MKWKYSKFAKNIFSKLMEKYMYFQKKSIQQEKSSLLIISTTKIKFKCIFLSKRSQCSRMRQGQTPEE